jgi:hypothetical protein
MFLAINSALNTAIRLAKCLEATRTVEERAVKHGHSRQEAHEKLKNFSLAARKCPSKNPGINFYMSLAGDEFWKDDELAKEVNVVLACDLTGLAAKQALGFLKRHEDHFN